MSAGQKYRRTEFDDDDNASINDVTSPGVVYNPVIAFRAASLGGSGPGSRLCPRRTPVEKLLFIVVCILVLIVFILVVLLAARSPPSDATTSSSRDLLTSPSIGPADRLSEPEWYVYSLAHRSGGTTEMPG